MGNLSRATRCMKEPQMGLDKRRTYRQLRSQILMPNSLMRRATKKPQSHRVASLAAFPLTFPSLWVNLKNQIVSGPHEFKREQLVIVTYRAFCVFVIDTFSLLHIRDDPEFPRTKV